MPLHAALLRLTQPRRLDLQVVRGDSVERVLVIRTHEQTRISLRGLVGLALVREAVDDPREYPLAVSVSQALEGEPTCGQVTITATGAATLLWPHSGWWGLQLADDSPDGTFRKSVVQGRLRLARDLVVP